MFLLTDDLLSDCEMLEKDGLQLGMIIHSYAANHIGPKFYTADSDHWQIGIHNKLKGDKTKPHYYRRTPITIKKPVQEILYVVDGAIKISLYNSDNKSIAIEKELSAGDILFIIEGTAHGVEFAEDTKLIEIKHGPFNANDKVIVD